MKNPIRVLIIEDNKDDAKLEIDELRGGGFDIVFELIETRKALREALKLKSWDCIISDYSMPQFNGLDALADLKDTGMDVPFILISGTIGEETAVAAMKAGAHDYIMKDNLSRLIPAFERELREAEVRHQKRKADEALKTSIENLKKQNAEYQLLNLEYLQQNDELIESLDRIQKINAELIVAKNKAEESDKLKSSFLANMSHEIRTPLNGILGFSDLLKDPVLSKEKSDKYIGIVESSGQQLLTIINDILDISKLEAGQMSIYMEATDINELMQELHQQFRMEAENKKLYLILNSENLYEPIVINTDGNRLRQVFCNLIINAIKFTSKGIIEFGLTLKNNFIEFYVKDTGIGIAPEDQSIIFRPFSKVAKASNHIYGGNGLGLSISKALIEQLGGIITLQSEPNKGSTFIFTIPYVKNSGTQAQKSSRTESDLTTDRNKKTILIAEDEQFNYYYIEELLEPLKINTLHAWNGKEAVEMAKKHPDISLVLMDILMPEMDGITATKLIKEMRPKLPVVAQTAFGSREDRENAHKSGFDFYLSKPIARELLVEVIDKYFG